jgi:hypothetical protein
METENYIMETENCIIESDTLKVATFGCWNRYKYEDGYIPMNMVMELLKANQTKYNDLIVLGDNYYGDKKKIKGADGKNIKFVDFNDDHFESGFKIIDDLAIRNKYLIMGNHDVEDTIDINCCGLHKQLNKNFIVKFPFGSVVNQLSDGTKIKYLFIDTTIYSFDEPEKQDENCYMKVLGSKPLTLMNDQRNFLVRHLETSTDDDYIYVIYGHEPLFSIKTKIGDETRKIKNKSSVLTELTNLILSNCGNKKIYYVCADVHMYQSGIVFNDSGQSIKQIVCGTGGGEKDNFNYGNKIFKQSGFSYCVDSSHDAYGYVELNINASGLTHEYVKLILDETDIPKLVRYSKKYMINYT